MFNIITKGNNMKKMIALACLLSSSIALASGGGAKTEIIRGFGTDLSMNHDTCVMIDRGLFTDDQAERLESFGYELKAEPSGTFLSISYNGAQISSRTVNGKSTVVEQYTYTLNNTLGLGGLGGLQIPIAKGVGRITSKKSVENAKDLVFDALIDTLPECIVE